jgi:hypothetical protein
VLFPERERERNYGEKWATLAEMRPVGSTQMFAAAPPPKPPTPQKLEDVKVGDLIEVYKRGGYGWFTARVMSVQNVRYYVQAGADSAMVGWVTPVHMRGVGAKERFEPEKLEQFFGDWRLRGDAFFTTTKTVRHSDRIEKTMELNSGAGQDAGRVVIKADGTYVLQKTVVYADNKPGKWVRNPDQSEGGIVLQGGQSDGKDLLVTPYPGGGIYLQGALRGPGKVARSSGRWACAIIAAVLRSCVCRRITRVFIGC